MYLIGDIGNSETKFCILNDNFNIIKRLSSDTSKINNLFFKNKIYPFIKNKKINNKVLFSSVVPSVFSLIEKNLKKKFNFKIHEVKKTDYS